MIPGMTQRCKIAWLCLSPSNFPQCPLWSDDVVPVVMHSVSNSRSVVIWCPAVNCLCCSVRCVKYVQLLFVGHAEVALSYLQAR